MAEKNFCSFVTAIPTHPYHFPLSHYLIPSIYLMLIYNIIHSGTDACSLYRILQSLLKVESMYITTCISVGLGGMA